MNKLIIALTLAGLFPASAALTNTSHTLTTPSIFSGISCGVTFAKTHLKSRQPMTALDGDSIPTGCNHLFAAGLTYQQAGDFKKSYDTLTYFVQQCPTNPYAVNTFGRLSTDVQGGGNGSFPDCLLSFREWLLSALAWNPHNAAYFCADVMEIGGTFGTKDTSWAVANTVTNKGLSIDYWIMHNPLCANSFDSELYTNSRGSQRETWFNTQDTSNVPLDTTIYSMHDLGLDSVLIYAAMLGVHSGQTETIISSATAYPNPFGEGTVVSFSTSREAYVKVELFDVLGNAVAATSFESVLQSGNHSVPIATHNLAAGTYYARILTTYGEVQTVKLVKE
jgi:hypothetical protein